MTKIVPVTPELHGAKRWRRISNYNFAVGDPLVPVVGAELSRLVPTMPLAFVERAGAYELMAVLSFAPGRNLFVGPDGRWLGGYIPAFFRSYPFRLLAREGTDVSVLCVDEDSKLIVGGESAGEDFFDADGKSSAAVKPILDMLSEVERSRKATQLAVLALAEAGVIQPWPIKLKTAQAEQAIGGLHRIDEAALNALGDEAFLKLRKASALTLADGQILSMGQLGIFEQLARLHSQPGPAPVAALPENLDSLLERFGDETIRFK